MRVLSFLLVWAAAFPFAAQTATLSCDEPVTPPALQGTNTSFPDRNGLSIDYETLIDAWFAQDGQPMLIRDCPGGGRKCLLVPQFKGSDQCTIYEHNTCDPGGTSICLVTDEFSQVGLALALARGATNATRFAQWFNTLQILRGPASSSDTTYTYRLPAWSWKLTWDATSSTLVRHDASDASDATARIILALYIAGNSPGADPAYRTAANEMAAAFIERDFAMRALSVRGRTVTRWLASGWAEAAGEPTVICTATNADHCSTFSFAGYHGDVAIALMAAYVNTQNTAYLDYAADTVQAYLYAAMWTSGHFAVPPKQFAYHSTTGNPPVDIKCKDTCGTDACGEIKWDGADAVRAVSLCKAAYYQRLAGRTIDGDVASYCNDWIATGGLSHDPAPPTYVKEYTLSGALCEGGSHDSYFHNALGSYLNFYCGTTDLGQRLAAVFRKYDSLAGRFEGESCFGVYNQAFALVSYGSALGRDASGFRLPLTATGDDTKVALAWAPIPGASSYDIYRRNDAAAAARIVSSWAATAYDDVSVSPGTAYVYYVCAAGTSVCTSQDTALPMHFTDHPIAAGTLVGADHVRELRLAVDAMRRTAGLSPASYTDPTIAPGSTIVRSVHIREIRLRLDEAFDRFGMPHAFYATTANAGSPIRAVDIADLRSAVR